MRIAETIYSVVGNKCPRCHKGHVFVNGNPYNLRNGLSMKESCEICQLKYERETGFFYGAMYVSYALLAGLFITLFVLDRLLLGLETWTFLLSFFGLVFALFPITFRWGRVLWLNMFVKYDKKYSARKSRSLQHRHS